MGLKENNSMMILLAINVIYISCDSEIDAHYNFSAFSVNYKVEVIPYAR